VRGAAREGGPYRNCYSGERLVGRVAVLVAVLGQRQVAPAWRWLVLLLHHSRGSGLRCFAARMRRWHLLDHLLGLGLPAPRAEESLVDPLSRHGFAVGKHVGIPPGVRELRVPQ
jgi:hypothetical protein